EGQATVALEILQQTDRQIDVLIIPVGGGGLAAGVAQVFAARSPQTRIPLVEPEGAPSLRDSLKEGRRLKLPQVNNFVDGAAVAEIGALPWEILKSAPLEQTLLVPEDRLCITILEMLNIEGVVLEPAGALEVDALTSLPPEEIAGKTVCCVTSGGNFDFERLPEVKERAMKAAGLKKYYILRLPQRPGALRDFLGLLGPSDDISRFEYLKKSARNFGSILLGIETNTPESFSRLEAAMISSGFQFRDITQDEVVASFIV
nr:pyridoxal-phosphate dependent enzyme [Paracoccaceae bacterium]